VGLGASWFWPKVGSRKDALAAISEAFWVASALAAFTVVLTLISFARSGQSDSNVDGFVYAALLAGAAFGIRQKSRVAALVAFVLYVALRGYFLLTTGHGSLVLTVVIALALFHGVRATFALHRLPSIPAGTPSVEQSFKAFVAKHRVDDKAKPE
jgi:hypothetical protein